MSGNGSGADRTGAGSADVVVKVPIGTQVFAEDQETMLADLDRPGMRVVLLRGGDGGFGRSLAIGVLDSQQHFAATPSRIKPVEKRRAGSSDMEKTGGRGRETGDDLIGHGLTVARVRAPGRRAGCISGTGHN